MANEIISNITLVYGEGYNPHVKTFSSVGSMVKYIRERPLTEDGGYIFFCSPDKAKKNYVKKRLDQKSRLIAWRQMRSQSKVKISLIPASLVI